MVKIVHYEVYVDKGNGWQLETRLPAEQRQDALLFAKENERGLTKVKVIKETFDAKDNTFQETVEYLGGNKNPALNAVSKNSKKSKNSKLSTNKSKPGSVSGATPFSAVVKAIVIIAVCLLLVNFIVTLVAPIIEAYAPQDLASPIIFAVFFITFLSISIPLLLKKVPWHAFAVSKNLSSIPVKEKKIYSQADTIIKWYNLNSDTQPTITTVYPDAPLEAKKDILSFLTEIISYVQSISGLKDSFSKLGVKLIIYGGCLELSKDSRLNIGQANALMFECFKIIDGKNADLEAFYEAKSSYNDNKVAVFLTGIGAYLMSQFLNERPIDVNTLQKSFEKWEAQNPQLKKSHKSTMVYHPLIEEEPSEIIVNQDCWVSILLEVSNLPLAKVRDENERIRGAVRNIIYNLVKKYGGLNVMESGNLTSISFTQLNQAIKLSNEFLKDLHEGKKQAENQEYKVSAKCAVVEASTQAAPSLSEYAEGVLQLAPEDSIIITESLKKSLDDTKYQKYNFDYVGRRSFQNGIEVSLYKVLA